MQVLNPYTISNSVKGRPSVLLTQNMEKFVFVRPIENEFMLAQNIYVLLHKHFKVDILDSGTFTIKGVKYLCAHQPEGILSINEWSTIKWHSKSEFNSLLNPHVLLKMFLINLYFPIFEETKKKVKMGKKDSFIADAYPVLQKDEGLRFNSSYLGQSELFNPDFIPFFKFIAPNIRKYIEEFQALNHENLYLEIKYQTSLYPTIRNKYWDEIKQCFSDDYKRVVNERVSRFVYGILEK